MYHYSRRDLFVYFWFLTVVPAAVLLLSKAENPRGLQTYGNGISNGGEQTNFTQSSDQQTRHFQAVQERCPPPKQTLTSTLILDLFYFTDYVLLTYLIEIASV